jgi:hypothetical protein
MRKLPATQLVGNREVVKGCTMEEMEKLNLQELKFVVTMKPL